jgi:hypothetical protein
MPQSLESRIATSLDVSGAFDNCFFHAYVTYLLANDQPLPHDLFTFKSILGEDSPASQLQKRFPNSQSLSLFAEYAHNAHPNASPLSPNFIVEKTIILGFLMREWFAQQLSLNLIYQQNIKAHVLIQFTTYKEYRNAPIGIDLLTSGPEGVLYTANKSFLEYFSSRPAKKAESDDELRFEHYFSDSASDNEALAAYWMSEGYQNYCTAIANPQTKLAYNNVAPVLEQLQQPFKIYNKADSTVLYEADGKAELPLMELALAAQSGHYHLLKDEQTTPLLDEYEASFTQYKIDREDVLSASEDKVSVAESKSSLFVGAICPHGHLNVEPFTFLLNKTDSFIHFNEQQRIAANPIPPQNPISPAQINFEEQLRLLHKKITHFEKHNHTKAAEVALELHRNLTHEGSLYFPNPNQETHQNFQEKCAEHIDKARPELEKHRGWGQVLANILIAVACAVVLYPIALGINKARTGNYLFFKTDSAKIIDEIIESNNNSAPGA